MNSGAAFSQIRRVRDLERRCFFSARWRGDTVRLSHDTTCAQIAVHKPDDFFL